ncbi:MAG: hypothetical protein KDB27_30360, partial [Planctomycetales bacterium]|nr:hypothetical protein [Planctomycetales bacterium]
SRCAEREFYIFNNPDYQDPQARAVAYYLEENGVPQAPSYLLRDGLGSVIHVSDSAGLEIERLSYDAFGQRRNPDWTPSTVPLDSESKEGFTNHEHLDSYSLIDMKARMYHPRFGRFFSPDSVIPNRFSSESLNRFSYVNNSPLSFVDPIGHQSCALSDDDCASDPDLDLTSDFLPNSSPNVISLDTMVAPKISDFRNFARQGNYAAAFRSLDRDILNAIESSGIPEAIGGLFEPLAKNLERFYTGREPDNAKSFYNRAKLTTGERLLAGVKAAAGIRTLGKTPFRFAGTEVAKKTLLPPSMRNTAVVPFDVRDNTQVNQTIIISPIAPKDENNFPGF